MRIPAQIHTYEGARPRALPEGLGFPVEKIEDMSAGEVSGEGAMRCRYAPVHDEVRGICDALGLDYDRVDRIATDRAGMLWAGEGMPHRFDACCEISDIARRLRAQSRDVASRSESPDPRRRPHR